MSALLLQLPLCLSAINNNNDMSTQVKASSSNFFPHLHCLPFRFTYMEKKKKALFLSRRWRREKSNGTISILCFPDLTKDRVIKASLIYYYVALDSMVRKGVREGDNSCETFFYGTPSQDSSWWIHGKEVNLRFCSTRSSSWVSSCSKQKGAWHAPHGVLLTIYK